MQWMLNETEKDLFKEIANIGLSKAADAFAILTRERVIISVPDVHLVNPNSLLETLADDVEQSSFIVQSDIKGEIKGKTLLLFSEYHVEKFVQECIETLKDFDGNVLEMRESLLLEISNIITGSIITQFSNIFGLNIYGSIPKIPPKNVVRSVDELLKEFPYFKPIIFTVKTKFINSGKLLELPMLILFDTDTLLRLIAIIRAPGFNLFQRQVKRTTV